MLFRCTAWKKFACVKDRDFFVVATWSREQFGFPESQSRGAVLAFAEVRYALSL